MSHTIKSYKYYYERYLLGVSFTRNVDYGDQKAVNRNNYGVKVYRKAASMIGKHYPERIGDFANLLNDDDYSLRITCAVSILSLMNAEDAYKEKALEIIRELAIQGSSFERLVWTEWLKDYGYTSEI